MFKSSSPNGEHGEKEKLVRDQNRRFVPISERSARLSSSSTNATSDLEHGGGGGGSMKTNRDPVRGLFGTTMTWTRTSVYAFACLALAACCVGLATSDSFPVERLPKTVREIMLAARGVYGGKDLETEREMLASSVFEDFCTSIKDATACEDVRRIRAGLGAVDDETFSSLLSRAKAIKGDESVDGVGFLGAYDNVMANYAQKPREVAKLVPEWSTAGLGVVGDGKAATDFIAAKKISVFVVDIFPLLRKYPNWDMSDTNQIRYLTRHMHEDSLSEESSRELANFMRDDKAASLSLQPSRGIVGVLPPKDLNRQLEISAFASKTFSRRPYSAHLFHQSPSALLGSEFSFNNDEENLPESFDARDEFPMCKRLLGTVRDQGKCGSCWAVAATEVMNDRLCVATKGKHNRELSPQYPLSCFNSGNRCDGGDVLDTMQAAVSNGIPFGGMLDKDECLPYEFEPCDHPCMVAGTEPQSCPAKCADGSELKLVYPKSNAYTCPAGDVACVAKEIQKYGSVGVTFGPVFSDFYNHKHGVYRAPKDAGHGLGLHATKLIGWGKTDEGEWYWIMVNSWRNWGHDGVGKVAMGEMNMESSIACIKMGGAE